MAGNGRTTELSPKLAKALKRLGRNIKAERVRAGLRQTDIVEKLGINYRHYQDIEAGKVNMKVETVLHISEVLGVQLGELFDCD